jgi:hypothetical protein
MAEIVGPDVVAEQAPDEHDDEPGKNDIKR